jgi:hypothetical protein
MNVPRASAAGLISIRLKAKLSSYSSLTVFLTCKTPKPKWFRKHLRAHTEVMHAGPPRNCSPKSHPPRVFATRCVLASTATWIPSIKLTFTALPQMLPLLESITYLTHQSTLRFDRCNNDALYSWIDKSPFEKTSLGITLQSGDSQGGRRQGNVSEISPQARIGCSDYCKCLCCAEGPPRSLLLKRSEQQLQQGFREPRSCWCSPCGCKAEVNGSTLQL